MTDPAPTAASGGSGPSAGGSTATSRGPRFVAVQESADAYSTVWSDPTAGSGMNAVFVLDEHGAQIAVGEWKTPDAAAADRALAQLGWARLTGWQPDTNGRPTADVRRLEIPAQATSVSAFGQSSHRRAPWISG